MEDKKNDFKKFYNIQDKNDIGYYFSRLRMRLNIGLLAAFIIPYLALLIYLHFPFNNSITNIGKLNLEALSKSQSNTVELFLQERVGNLFSLFYSAEFRKLIFSHYSSQETSNHNNLGYYLENLKRISDSFIDLGFFDKSGIQKKYAGPFLTLYNKNYSNEKWFQELIKSEKNYYISDIYLGFRNKPHFTVAVKQNIEGKINIVRSTIDPEKFYLYLRSIIGGKEVDSYIINKAGVYQVVAPDKEEFIGVSNFIPPLDKKSGAAIINIKNIKYFVGYSWFADVPWALVVKQPQKSVKSPMYKARIPIIAGSGAILIIISLLILFTTYKLIAKAKKNAETRSELWNQLRHASKLASVGELATGVAHEINNPLAIIIATSGVIQDMLNPEFKMNPTPEDILKELKIINDAVLRAKKITHQLLDYGRENKPSLKLSNINDIIDNTIGELQHREFELENIIIEKNYEKDLPDILIDQDQLRQVILNIINNAKDAIFGSGKISIFTKKDNENLYIEIMDTGCGMNHEQIMKIFNPFFTTKEVGKGTGLGLSVSLNIIKSMGGDISVQSLEGRGSCFNISLPIYNKGDNNE